MDKKEIQKRAAEVRDEYREGANTSAKVGGLMYDALTYLSDEVDKFRNFKGYYESLSALQSSITKPAVGNYAYVGPSYPGNVYRYTSSGWANTGTAGSIPAVNLAPYAKVVDLNATNDQVALKAAQADLETAQTKIVQLEQETSTLQTNVNNQLQAQDIDFQQKAAQEFEKNKTYVDGKSIEIKPASVTPETLSESTKQLINTAGGGSVTNLADDEDLVSANGVIKLKDKAYQPSNFSGLGRKILRKNIDGVSGKNILTQAMINQPNTIYEIGYDYDLNGATITIPEGCTLNFVGGKIIGGVINLNNCIVKGDVLITSNILGKLANDTVYVRWFGAIGDGITDDSDALVRAVKATKKQGATFVFDGKTYIHGDGIASPTGTGNSYVKNPTTGGALQDATHPSDIGRQITLIFGCYNNLTVKGNGATIKSHPNNGECKHNQIFLFHKCNNLHVTDLNIDASKDTRNIRLNDYSTGQARFTEDGEYIQDPTRGYAQRGNFDMASCNNVLIERVHSNNSLMDGLSIYGDQNLGIPEFITFKDCSGLYNYRMGLVISSVNNCTVVGGEFSYTGYKEDKTTTLGIMPMAGIDVEADSFKSKNIFIQNAVLKNNKVSGIIYSKDGTNIKTSNCYFEGKGVNVVNLLGCANNEVSYNYFYNCACGLIQENLNVHHNIFKFDKNSGSVNFAFDAVMDGEPHYSNSMFTDNYIELDPEGIDTLSDIKPYYGCFRIDANVILKNNIFKNLYSSNNYIMLAKVYSADNNTFIHDIERYPILANQKTSLQLTTKVRQRDGGCIERGITNNTTIGDLGGLAFANMIEYRQNVGDITISKDTYAQEDKFYKIPSLSFNILVYSGSYTYEIHGDYNSGGYYNAIIYKSISIMSATIDDLPVVVYYQGGNAFLKIRTNNRGFFKMTLYKHKIDSNQKIDIQDVGQFDISGYLPMRDANVYQSGIPEINSRMKGHSIFNATTGKPCWLKDGATWVDADGLDTRLLRVGATSQRPSLTSTNIGFQYYDTTLKKYICWNGTAWTNLDGTALI